MSYLKNRLNGAFQKIIVRAGTPIRVQYFNIIYDDVYDEQINLTQSGADLWTSGIIFSLNNTPGQADALLVEQGKLLHTDSKLFLHGSLLLNGSELTTKITVGSPSSVDTNYSIIFPGTNMQSVQDTPIYKVVYIRKIGGVGSLYGE